MSRARGVVRATFVIAATALLLGMLLWLAARLWALHYVRTAVPEYEAKYGSLDPEQWRRPPIPDADNAARYMEAAALLFEQREPYWSTWRKSRDGGGELEVDNAVERAFEGLVELNRVPLEIWLEGGKRSSCALRDALPEPQQRLPPYFAMMHVAQVHTALARRDFTIGQDDRAIARLSSALAASACLQADLTYTAHMVGLAAERRLMPDLRSALEAGNLDGHLGKLQKALEAIQSRSAQEYLHAEAATFQPGAWWRDQVRYREEVGPWYWPFAVTGFSAAAALRGNALTRERLDDPEPPPPPSSKFWPWQFGRYMYAVLGESYWTTERLQRAQRSVRALAVRALAMRHEGLATGRYSTGGPASESTPLIGETIVIEARADGSVELALPGSAAYWTEFQPLTGDVRGRTLDWAWTLPPIERREPPAKLP